MTDEELFVISFFVFELRKDVYVVLAFDTPFSTLYSLFIASGNSKAKKLSVSHFVLLLCTHEVQSCHADDHPRKDFWLIVFRFWACHSARTAKATVFIFVVYFLCIELFKNSKFQYIELAPSPLANCTKKRKPHPSYQYPVTLMHAYGKLVALLILLYQGSCR